MYFANLYYRQNFNDGCTSCAETKRCENSLCCLSGAMRNNGLQGHLDNLITCTSNTSTKQQSLTKRLSSKSCHLFRCQSKTAKRAYGKTAKRGSRGGTTCTVTTLRLDNLSHNIINCVSKHCRDLSDGKSLVKSITQRRFSALCPFYDCGVG